MQVTQVTTLFLFFTLSKLLVEVYLSYRNNQHVKANQKAVPKQFQSKIELSEHQKAAQYTMAKGRLQILHMIFDTLVLFAWTIFGGLNALYLQTKALNFSLLWTDTLFFLFFTLIGALISLPFGLYSTFVLEEKFGFNKTTLKIFMTDLLKQTVLGIIIGVPLILGLLSILQMMGDLWWLYAWAFLSLFQLIMIWAYPTLIAPLFNKFEPLEDGETKEKIVALLQRLGFSHKGLFVMNASMRSSHGNAYFTGFGKNKRIVFFDTLLNSLNPQEVESVLAHELGHFKHKHILKMIIRSFILSLIGFAILGQLIHSEVFLRGHGLNPEVTSMACGLLLFALVSSVYTFFLTPLTTWLSRKNEFEADSFAAQHASAQHLIEALVKMYKDNASTLTPDPIYSNFYHSHPPALIRVKHLEGFKS